MFKSKKFLKLSLLVFFILIVSVGAVSAANDTSDFNTNLGDSNSVSETISLTGASNSTGSISDLQNLIDKDTTGNISLDRNYTYNSVSDENKTEGVSVTKNLTINGNGYTLNGNNQGGLISVYDSTLILKDLNLINGNNTDFEVSGAVYAENSTLIIDNCNFINNTYPIMGGGICAINSTLLVTDSLFRDNKAMYGGAIYTENSDSIINNTQFENNTGIYSGGAIYNELGFLNVLESNFTANSIGNLLNLTSDTFYVGGAIASNGSLNVSKSNFKSNFAMGKSYLGFGGAIYIVGNESSINDCIFLSNFADYTGGAIYSEADLELINSVFIGNVADFAGAVCGKNSKLYINSSNFTENMAFTVNANNPDYNYGGGAIFTFNSSLAIGNSQFTNNSAIGLKDLNNSFDSEGGAILTVNTTSLLYKNIFLSNNANTSGGAILTVNSVTVIGNNTFKNNTAHRSGGAIFSYKGFLTTTDSLFIGNNVNSSNILSFNTYGGGAIGVDGALFINNTSFVNNSALGYNEILILKGYGGAILSKSNETYILNSNFINNTAESIGGAIFSLSNLSINNSRIINNTEINLPGTIVIENGILNLSNSVIVGENPIYIGVYNSTADLNYNWWGDNNYPVSHVSNYDNLSNISLNNWIIMTLNVNPLNVGVNDLINVNVSLNHYTDGNNIYIMTSEIPEVMVNLNALSSDGSVNESIFDRTLGNILDYDNYSPSTSGVYTISASIHNQILNQSVNVKPLINQSTILNLPYYTFVYGENNTLIGVLTDINGNPLSNRTVSLNLSRDSDDAWKIYNVTTNSLGEFKLLITLNPGDYGVKATFNGDEEYNSSYANVSMKINNVIINTSDLKINTSTSPNSFNGTISTFNGTPLGNKLVIIYISRLSDGASKVYRMLSNSEGEFSLAINLDPGNYYVQTQFLSDDYIISLKDNFITVNGLSNETKQLTNSYTVYNNDLNPETRELNGVLYTLTDNTKIGVNNVNVTLELTRLSDGASKNYTITTNNEGQYTLPIHLDADFYDCKTFFARTNNYQASTSENPFEIDE